MKVRTATKDDIGAVLRIWNPIIRDTAITFSDLEKTPTDVAAMLEGRAHPGGEMLVAESDGIIGFAGASPFRRGPGYRFTLELSVHVAPDWRGRGVGTELVRRLMAQARAAGAHSIYAGISAENPDAMAFHGYLGFREIAVLPEAGHKFGRWIDLHLLMAWLRDGFDGE